MVTVNWTGCSKRFSTKGRCNAPTATSGMIMSAVCLLNRNPHPSQNEIVDFMNGTSAAVASIRSLSGPFKRQQTRHLTRARGRRQPNELGRSKFAEPDV